jgi:hypothetical protein
VPPSPKLQLKVKGPTPPVGEAVKVSGRFASGDVGFSAKLTPTATAGTVTVTLRERIVELQLDAVHVPVTVTLYLPAGVAEVAVTVRVEVPDIILLVRTMLALLNIAVGPLVTVGLTAVDKPTVPVPPSTLLTVIVDVPGVVGVTVSVVGLADMT